MTAILWLSEHRPVGAADLARWLGISTAATTVLVDRLERVGTSHECATPSTASGAALTETADARAAALRAWLPAIQEIDQVSRSLSEPERVFARDLLTRLTAAMTRGGRP
jgi:DNA-binding MarR family transcriptional regulator